MKKSLARKITLSILAGAVLMSSSVVWAGVTVDVAPGSSVDGWIKVELDSNSVTDEYAPGTNGILSASDNTVNLSSGTYESFAGAYSSNGNVVNNKVTINVDANNNANFTRPIYGGYAVSGAVEKNTVSISGGEFVANNSIYGGYTTSGDANKNKITIEDGSFTYGGKLYGGYSLNGDASYNEIEVGGTLGSATTSRVSVYGGNIGDSTAAQSANGNASNNKVTLGATNAYYNNVYGGVTNASNGNANNNVITITGGDFSVFVYGGYSANGDANENVITITGGKFSGTISGGKADNGSAINNTINIAGSADLSSAVLLGGDGSTISSDLLTDNVLNIGDDNAGWKGTVIQVSSFEKINFNNLEWEADKAALTVSGVLGLGKTNQKTTVMVNSLSKEGAKPKEGETMTLIAYNNLSGSGLANDEQEIKIGSFVKAEGLIKQDTANKKITLTLTKVSANEQALVIGESRAAATAFTNQGSEIIETGLDALARDNDKDTKVFAALYGNASEFATGSHVKVNGWSGMVGVGKTNADGLTVGAFFENGEGNYRTYNTVDGDFMRGDGEACYNGGGFLVRKDNANGVYTEASLRAGNLQNELRNAVLAGDKLAGYDIDTFYYGAHVGIGKVIPRGNDGDSIDVYGKFIYTHHDSENFKIDGDDFHFDSVDSERLRLGFRINEVQTDKLNMYYGAAWEYEFGGDADNTVVGYDLSTPSLEGSTVIGEIGAHYKASDKWSLDLNARAYVGQREGFSGSVQANYSF